MDEKRVPAITAGNGNVSYPPVEGIMNNSPSCLLNFCNRHSLVTYRIVASHPEGLMVSEIQDLAGYHRGDKGNMVHRREIARCAEVLAFYKYFMKKGYRYFPTEKKPRMDDTPREFGNDGLPRVRLQTQATMPLYGRI